LVAEFEYAANSAFQANEDRSKAASFFLISVGSLVASIFGTQEFDTYDGLYWILAGLFLVLTFLGVLTVIQLARLREAWRESARTMNRIKDYYIERFPEIELKQAFRWRTETLPNKYKRDSISHYTAIEVAMLSGLTFGASVFFFQLEFSYYWSSWLISASAAGIAFVAIRWFYKRLLTK
jgi:ABC-type multidrug transport system fused ATPase/permease subunit